MGRQVVADSEETARLSDCPLLTIARLSPQLLSEEIARATERLREQLLDGTAQLNHMASGSPPSSLVFAEAVTSFRELQGRKLPDWERALGDLVDMFQVQRRVEASLALHVATDGRTLDKLESMIRRYWAGFLQALTQAEGFVASVFFSWQRVALFQRARMVPFTETSTLC